MEKKSKSKFFMRLKKLFKFAVISKIAIILVLLYGVDYCLWFFQKWNKIPTHQIEANLSAEGLLSDKSYCNLRLRMNAGSTSLVTDSLSEGNMIEIGSYGNYSDTIALDKLYNGKCGYVYRQHPEKFKGKTTFYFLDFLAHTNIKTKPRNKDCGNMFISDDCTLSYIEQPLLTKDSTGTTAVGSGLLGFSQCGGEGKMLFHTNLINSFPKLITTWDISQAIYDVKFISDKIKCDTISIEFVGATNFSSMHPIPDKITMSGMEFTDSTKISMIQSGGLRFHTEFLQLKEMSARRTFLLSAVLSLLISIIASLLFKLIFD